MNTISTIVRIKLASFICVAPALFSAPALAQKMIPVPAPTGVSNTSTPPLPAPLTRDEQRFRELASYIKSRGSIDAQTRAEIVKLAVDIDKDLTAAIRCCVCCQRARKSLSGSTTPRRWTPPSSGYSP